MMDILFLPFHDGVKGRREGFRTRDGHFFQEFVRKGQRVLLVNRPMHVAERMIRAKTDVFGGPIVARMRKGVITQVTPTSYELTTFVPQDCSIALWPRRWWDHQMRRSALLSSIQEARRILGMRHLAIYCANPLGGWVVSQLNAAVVAADLIDNWKIHPQFHELHGILDNRYQELMTASDVVFANSVKTAALAKSYGKEAIVILNGVSRSWLSISRHEDERPRRVRVAYAGKIQERLDVALVERAVDAFPEADFVFMGPVFGRTAFTKLLRRKNMVYMGDIHYDKLPALLSTCDIGIIPHKVGGGEVDGDPIKLYEYLALGLFVVTTSIGGVTSVCSAVDVAHSAGEFVDCLGDRIRDVAQGVRPVRVSSVGQEHFWDSKAEIILKTISAVGQLKQL